MTAQTSDGRLIGRLFRFLVVGGTNTAITAAIVVGLSFFMPAWIAFTIAYVLGMAYSLALTGRWVFQSRVSWSRSAVYTASYLAIYLCGLGFVHVLQAWEAPPIANAATVLLTAPLSFVAGMFIFSDDKRKNRDH